MNMLCDVPEGPHTAGKERLLCALAQAVSYHHEDGRHRYMKEGIIFLIKNTRPDDLRMGVTAMGCECAFALLATMWFPRVRQGAQLAGHNSFHAESTKGMHSRGRRFWRSLLRALHKPWRQQRQH